MTEQPAVTLRKAGHYIVGRADLRQEFRMGDDGDAWGNVMQWLFAIAAELHYRDPDNVPDDWHYRPTPIRPDDPRERDDWQFATLEQTSTDDLVQFGTVLQRYKSRLVAAGQSY